MTIPEELVDAAMEGLVDAGLFDEVLPTLDGLARSALRAVFAKLSESNAAGDVDCTIPGADVCFSVYPSVLFHLRCVLAALAREFGGSE